MKHRRRTGFALVPAVVVLGLLSAAPSGAVTIGADVTTNAQFLSRGTCFESSGNRCVSVTNKPTPGITGGAQMLSPCDGTVTGFRINGVPTNNTYRLRVVQMSSETTATAVSSSVPVSLSSDGVNPFPANLPIRAGNQIGLEFYSAIDFQSVRFRMPADSVATIYGLPESGSATGANGSLEYLFNADVECGTPVQPTKKKCKKKAKKKSSASAAKKKKGCKKRKKKK
jgi:hypothetical protein